MANRGASPVISKKERRSGPSLVSQRISMTKVDFFGAFLEAPPGRHNHIYGCGAKKSSIGEELNTLTLILACDWPRLDGIPVPARGVFRSPEAIGILSQIFRLKGLIERSIRDYVDLLDVVPGCVTVRFLLPKDVPEYLVIDALETLRESRTDCRISHVSASVRGKSIQ